jgi:hypothetical protein
MREDLDRHDNLTLLHMMFHAMLVDLNDRLADKPTAAYLQVTRKFLRDFGEHIRADGEEERQQFVRIRKAYLDSLEAALKRPHPSAAVLREAFTFLDAADLIKGVSSLADAQRAMTDLADLDLPFQ